MIEYLVTLSTGFSVVAAILLLCIYVWLYRLWNKPWRSIAAAAVLLLSFAVLQTLHWFWFEQSADLYASKWYSSLVLLTAPAFYFFVRDYILSEPESIYRIPVHVVPLVVNLFIPNRWSIPLSFLIGAVYAGLCLFWLMQLQGQRKRFKIEIAAIASFLLLAIIIGLLALLAPLETIWFVTGYTFLIGLSFLAIVALLLLVPETAQNINEAAENRYARSTLTQVDRAGAVSRLEILMQQDGLYRNEGLSLADVAEQLKLTTHQLSELINAEFGHGFSQYIREHRINHAKRQLLAEPQASVLSIGLDSGFTSQSSFYTAFGKIVGQSPGKYRSSHLK